MTLFLLAACAPRADLVVVEAEEIGTVPRSEWIGGRDGGSSSLAFGRTVWVYGDTVLTDVDEDGSNWHTNSYAHADPATWRDGFTEPGDSVGAPRFFVPLSAEEEAWNARPCDDDPCPKWALWPGPPVVDEASGRAWILYGLYNEAQPSGIGIASWDGLDAPVVRRDGLLFPEPEIEWANPYFVHDGHLLAFGCPLRGLARPCFLGRAPLESPDDRTSWTFWDGERWSSDPDDAVRLFEGAPIMEVSFDAALDRWLLVYSGPFSGVVTARTAPEPTGPWSAEIRLFDVPGDFPYDAVHHAEIEEDGGLVQYVTYSRHTTGWFGSEHALWRVRLEPAR